MINIVYLQDEHVNRNNISFIVDSEGKKKFAVLPIELYCQLLRISPEMIDPERVEELTFDVLLAHRGDPAVDQTVSDSSSSEAADSSESVTQENDGEHSRRAVSRSEKFYLARQLTEKYAEELKKNNTELFFFSAKNVLAWGYPQGDMRKPLFVVMAKSEISGSVADSFRCKAQEVRDALIMKKIIKKKNDSYIFTQDYTFNSASLAACVIAGNNRSGAEAWKTFDGKPLKDFLEPSSRRKKDGE